jgi:hypothetical protein
MPAALECWGRGIRHLAVSRALRGSERPPELILPNRKQSEVVATADKIHSFQVVQALHDFRFF